MNEIKQTKRPVTNARPQRWTDYDPHLQAADLQGRAITLTIRAVDTAEVYDERAKARTSKPILHFQGAKKYLILSPTNRKSLIRAFGNDCQLCVGQKVTLQAVEVKAFGKATMPIRISIPTGNGASVDVETGEVEGEDTEAPSTPEDVKIFCEIHPSDEMTYFSGQKVWAHRIGNTTEWCDGADQKPLSPVGEMKVAQSAAPIVTVGAAEMRRV